MIYKSGVRCMCVLRNNSCCSKMFRFETLCKRRWIYTKMKTWIAMSPHTHTTTARSCSPHICCLSLSEWPAIDKKLCTKWISLAPFTQTLAHHRQCGCVHVHKIHIVQLPAACVLVQKQDFLLWKQKDSMATIPKYTTHVLVFIRYKVRMKWAHTHRPDACHAMPILWVCCF